MLIVDDQPAVLSTLTRFLALKGYETVMAASAPEALEAIAGRQFDAFVIDIRLGSGSGLELLQTLREDERWRDVPAVLLTGAVLTRDEQTRIAQLRARVFFKPKSYEALTRHLDVATAAK